MDPATHTLILGGGFGGLTAANALRDALPAEHTITVVDADPRFHVGAGKTWVMLGERTAEEVSQPRERLLAPGIELLEAAVEGIHVAERRVAAGGRSLAYDHLVIALGADVDLGAVPGLPEAAHTFYTLPGAERLRGALEAFASGDLVLLIPRAPFKCPPAPYEAIMLIHDALEARGVRDGVRLAVYTLEGTPMATAGPAMGHFVEGALAERGIAFHPGRTTERVDADARRIAFQDGTEARYDLLIAIPPHVAPSVVREAGLAGPSGWVPVDPQTLRVQSAGAPEGVYAIGDVTTLPLPGRFRPDAGLVLPKAGVFAQAQARVVADHIAAAVLGRKPATAFDGRGYCYLEVGGGQAVSAEGDFFALPNPTMAKATPDAAQHRDKLDWVAGLLAARR